MISKLTSGIISFRAPDGSFVCTGSAMGRPGARPLDRNVAARFYLVHVRLNSGGYDSGGAYWGTGQPLYRYESVDEYETAYRGPEQIEGYLRADDRADARAQILALYPSATFFR